MSITIENPTAEAVWQAIQQLPASEMERLRVLLGEQRDTAVEEEDWRAASMISAARFFEDEEK